MDYKKKYENAVKKLEKFFINDNDRILYKHDIENVFPELKENKDERIRKMLVERMKRWHECALENNVVQDIKDSRDAITWLEKQEDANKEYWRGYKEGKQEIIDKYSELEKQGEQKPNFCHHEVDFSNCSEEYRKAYYDGWNNCNQQHSQLKAEQKPAWSEEDDRHLSIAIQYVFEHGYLSTTNWLKSLKERMKGE